MQALDHLSAGVRQLRPAIAALAADGTPGTPRSSLNQPIGPHRRLAVARADLATVQRAAHAHGATVNDVVVAAVTGALHAVLNEGRAWTGSWSLYRSPPAVTQRTAGSAIRSV